MPASPFSLPTVCTALKILTRPETTRSRVRESSTVPAYLQASNYFYRQLAVEQETPPFDGSTLYQVPATSDFRRLAHRLLAALQAPNYLTSAQQATVLSVLSQWMRTSVASNEQPPQTCPQQLQADCLTLKRILTVARINAQTTTA